MRANISSFTRHHPNVMMTKAKISGNYANSFLAKTESVRLGFEEAIMLDPEGYVAECTGENLFVVKNGRIITPDLAPVLDGITRDAVITLARDHGYRGRGSPDLARPAVRARTRSSSCGTACGVHRAAGDRLPHDRERSDRARSPGRSSRTFHDVSARTPPALGAVAVPRRTTGTTMNSRRPSVA